MDRAIAEWLAPIATILVVASWRVAADRRRRLVRSESTWLAFPPTRPSVATMATTRTKLAPTTTTTRKLEKALSFAVVSQTVTA